MTDYTQASSIFWDVDTQVDFLAPTGKLYVPGSASILPKLATLTALAAQLDLPRIASACAHDPGDDEFKNFPPHCLRGTPGQQKVSETQCASCLLVPNHPITLPSALPREILIEKQFYDVFTNPNTEPLVVRFTHRPTFYLYGVVTEICVASAAKGLVARGHRVAIIHDAIHHLDLAVAQKFLESLKSQGATFLTTAELPAHLATA